MKQFRYRDALVYPYRHYLHTIIVPGAIVYVEMICIWVLIITLVIIVAVIAGALGASLSALPDSLESLLAALQQHISPASDGGILMVASEEKDSLSSLSNSPNFSFNSGSSAGPIYYLLWCGYEWRMYGRWAEKGLDADPPQWNDNFWGIVVDGLKGAAFYGVLRMLLGLIVMLPLGVLLITNWTSMSEALQEMLFSLKNSTTPPEWILPFILAFCAFFLLLWIVDFLAAPFFIAPLIHSCKNRTLSALFDSGKAMETGGQNYGNVLIAFLLIGATAIMYFVGGMLFGFATCCMGFLLFPFLFSGAFRTTAAHLLAQAYDLDATASNESPVVAAG